MKRWRSMFTLCVLAAFVFCTNGCDWGESGSVSTDLIHIPATASTATPTQVDVPAIAFTDTLVELGIISEGTQADVVFSFQNTGDAALILSDVSTSCGCTLAEQWPREPIQPGGNGEVAVRFDSRGRVGANRKEVFVVTNAVPSTTTLILTAEVIGPSTKE
jgi:hypothetical protein